MAIPEERGVWLICMAISLVFWLLVKMSKTYITNKPVTYDLTISDDRALATLPPANLAVDLESTGWNLIRENFQQDSVRINVDLKQTDRLVLDGTQLRAAVKDRLVSREINIVDLNYNRLIFDVEEKRRKRIPIRVQSNIEFHPEYHLLGPIEVRPDSTWISGPASQVPLFSEVSTDTFNFFNLNSSQTIQVPLQMLAPTLTLNPEQVTVVLNVEQYTEWEDFVPLKVMMNVQDSLNLFPKQVLLTCTVGLSRYDQLSANDFTVEIDLRNVPLSKNKNTVPIRVVQQPDYVKNVSISPKAAEFYLVKTGEE